MAESKVDLPKPEPTVATPEDDSKFLAEFADVKNLANLVDEKFLTIQGSVEETNRKIRDVFILTRCLAKCVKGILKDHRNLADQIDLCRLMRWMDIDKS